VTHKDQLSLGRIGGENILPIVLRRNSPLPLTMVISVLAKIIPLPEVESSTIKLIANRSHESPISLIALIKQGQCFSDKEARQNPSATQEHL
jgi:hypothetical protein